MIIFHHLHGNLCANKVIFSKKIYGPEIGDLMIRRSSDFKTNVRTNFANCLRLLY